MDDLIEDFEFIMKNKLKNIGSFTYAQGGCVPIEIIEELELSDKQIEEMNPAFNWIDNIIYTFPKITNVLKEKLISEIINEFSYSNIKLNRNQKQMIKNEIESIIECLTEFKKSSYEKAKDIEDIAFILYSATPFYHGLEQLIENKDYILKQKNFTKEEKEILKKLTGW